jgi:hypothetical protein
MRRALLTLCSTLALAGTATAQAEPLDQGTLSIRIADVEVAREQFTLIQGRRGGLPGSTVRAVASYPAARPRHRYTGILERTGPQTLAAFQVELAGDPPGRDAPASIVLSGGIEGRILLDEAGRFQGLLLPARKIEVLRLPE